MDDAIDFWQTLKINTETTLTDVLTAFDKEYAKKDLKEVSKYQLDQMRYEPTSESFTDFLTIFKKTAKQAYGERANDIAESFPFAKLPVQLQNELAIAGHRRRNKDVRATPLPIRSIAPGTSAMQPLNQAFNYQPKQQNAQPDYHNNTVDKTNTAKEIKRRFEGNCRFCNILGLKWVDCRTRLSDEANGINTKTQQRPQQANNNGQQQQIDKPRYNSKLVSQICGKVGHSARDCRNRVSGASAYLIVPYEKQSTTENREFHRDFKQSQNIRQPAYQVTHATEQPTRTEIHNDCYDMEYNKEFESNSKNL